MIKNGHGAWLKAKTKWKNRFVCSNCDYYLFSNPTNFCPNCGARMEVSEIEVETVAKSIFRDIEKCLLYDFDSPVTVMAALKTKKYQELKVKYGVSTNGEKKIP